jgi:tRNA pseudouridine38-40 synthase
VKDRTKASNTFLPNGLYLANIEYDKKFKIPFLNNKILL